MSKNAYILEAFKQFDSLTEDEDVIEREEMPIYDVNSEKMHDFLDTVGDDSDISIIDLEAEAEEDLKQSYVGKIILDCNVCHSNVFIDKDEIVVDEEGLANTDLECPYCMSNEGYTIIGQVEPYSEVEEEIPEEDVEIDIESEEIPDEEPIEEGMKLDGTKKLKGTRKLWRRADKDGDKKIRGRANSEISGTEDLRESKKQRKRRRVKESIEDVTINTENETMTMTTKEDGGVVVETSPIDSESMLDEPETFEPESEVEPDEEVIAPISDEVEDEVELNSEVENLDDEDIESLEEPDEFDVEDFDEESFDELGESYLREHYDNVDGFKTVNAKVFNNSLIVEGVIRFNSGSSKGTSFVFEPVNMNKNAVLFEGYNKQISRGKKTFKLSCGLNEKMLTPNKMSYNYITRNELNESVRVNGTVKVK